MTIIYALKPGILKREEYSCQSCHGVFLPFKFLLTLGFSYEFELDTLIANLNAAKIKSTLYPCPSCSQLLDCSISHTVKLEYCVNCNGIWFDKNELTELVTYQKNRLKPNYQAGDLLDILFKTVELLDLIK